MKKQFIFSLMAAAITLGAVSSVKPVDITAARNGVKSDDSITMSKEYGRKHPTTEVLLATDSDDNYLELSVYYRTADNCRTADNGINLCTGDADIPLVEIDKSHINKFDESLSYYEGLKELEKKCSTTPQRKIELESEKLMSLKPIELNDFIVKNGNPKNNLKK